MDIFDASPSEEGGTDLVAAIDQQQPPAPEQQLPPETPPETPPEETKIPVHLGRKQRAEQAQQQTVASISELKSLLEQQQRDTAEREQRFVREIAELRGGLTAAQQFALQQRQQAAPTAPANPDELMRKAAEALNPERPGGADINEYHRYLLQAQQLLIQQQIAQQAPQVQQSQGTIPPQALPYLIAHPEVAKAGDRGAQLVMACAQMIEARTQGQMPREQLVKAAFAEAERQLRSTNRPAAPPSARTQAALGGSTPTRVGQARDPNGRFTVEIDRDEAEVAAAFRMSNEDYAQALTGGDPNHPRAKR